MTTCANPIHHRPRPLVTQKHHILPRSWSGPTSPANTAILCGSCHDNVHHVLDTIYDAAKAGEFRGLEVPDKHFWTHDLRVDSYAVMLAREGWRRLGGRMPARRALPPRVRPGTSDEHDDTT